MPRAYIRAGTRLRQLERFVRAHHELHGTGATIVDLRELSGLSYQAVCAYMVRMVREQRVEVTLEDPALGAKSQQRFYPNGEAPRRLPKAA